MSTASPESPTLQLDSLPPGLHSPLKKKKKYKFFKKSQCVPLCAADTAGDKRLSSI